MPVHVSKGLQTHRRRERVVTPSAFTTIDRQECTRVRSPALWRHSEAF